MKANFPVLYGVPAAFTSSSVCPTDAHSGHVYTMEGTVA